MRGDLWSPRLVFEHDPDNNDIGSTRALEALPMFLNHRPVMEGLYMESAILGPATYQLQSEVSARPSSPLARFPSGQLDPDFAARHMNFLHAELLLLRSSKAKEAIEASGLFEKIAESAPFSVYRLKQFTSHLIQVVTQPIRVLPMQNWMQDAFDWFRTRSQFDAFLPVFGESVPAADLRSSASAPRVKLLSRHRMTFETEAVGQPHLIKIAYHPRWKLVSKGTLQIAGPGFMLVVPQEREIQLDYGHTWVGTLGMFATLGCLLYLALFSWRKELRPTSVVISAKPGSGRLRRWLPVAAGWLVLILLGAHFWLNAPERIYNAAWVNMRGNRYEEASAQLAQAYKLRRPTAKKEEALFWLAKATELAGHRAEAKNHYRELVERYHGYWVPESLYTASQLELTDGRKAEAEAMIRRLREEYPGNTWEQKLDKRD
jgi:tetratricopeptide (TPR) repeat protein